VNVFGHVLHLHAWHAPHGSAKLAGGHRKQRQPPRYPRSKLSRSRMRHPKARHREPSVRSLASLLPATGGRRGTRCARRSSHPVCVRVCASDCS
jgi:hypothetical protein